MDGRYFVELARAAALAGVFAGGVAGAQAPEPGAGPGAPAEVGVVTVAREAVPETLELPGRAVAYEQVAVRPRVEGVVTGILYTPGQPLKAGDPLFQLDDATYVAGVASDEATLAQAEADLPVKQAAYDRASRLVNQGYTQAEVESAQSDLASAQATLDAARASLDYAETQLSWTTIRSPIDGVPEVQSVSVGDLVTAAQDTELTTVTRLDPIYVDMLDTSTRLLEIRRRIDDGTLTVNADLHATLVLEDGQIYTGTGGIVAPSAMVSTSTGTISLRFEFENPEHQILPGMFVHGTVEIGTTNAWLVPQRATTLSTTGELTAFVAEDGKAKLVTLTQTGTRGGYWIVQGGLADGDELIVDGLKTLAAGAEVTSVAVTLDEDGLTRTEGGRGADDEADGDPASAPTSAPTGTPAGAPASGPSE